MLEVKQWEEDVFKTMRLLHRPSNPLLNTQHSYVRSSSVIADLTPHKRSIWTGYTLTTRWPCNPDRKCRSETQRASQLIDVMVTDFESSSTIVQRRCSWLSCIGGLGYLHAAAGSTWWIVAAGLQVRHFHHGPACTAPNLSVIIS